MQALKYFMMSKINKAFLSKQLLYVVRNKAVGTKIHCPHRGKTNLHITV